MSSHRKAESIFADGLLTINEAAQYMRCSRATVNALLRTGALSYTRLSAGGDRRIPKRGIDTYLTSRLVVSDVVA